jgi:transcriptional antiterminator
MNNNEIRILNLLIQSEIIHYSDIANLTGKSRSTVAKYLNDISNYVAKFDVRLIRKRNVGIYLEGDLSKLSRKNHFKDKNEPENSDQRSLNLLTDLLTADSPVKVQTLAEKNFLSRSSIDNDIKNVKLLISGYDAKIITTSTGIQLKASEREKRKIMSQLIDLYWGAESSIPYQVVSEEDTKKLSPKTSDFFSQETLIKTIKAVELFKKKTALKLSDYEFQSLVIHIAIATERIKNDQVLKSAERFLPLEENTKVLTEIIEKEFEIKLPDDEKQYLNIHILAAENLLDSINKNSSIKGLENSEISNFLMNNLNHFDSILISNLTVHLIPALKRLLLGLTIRNPYTSEIKRYFSYSYNGAVTLGTKIKSEYGVSLNDDELAYIALHIEAFNERNHNSVTAALVCSTGLGTARLLEQRIKRQFPDQIKITRVVSLQEIQDSHITEDLVISTINVKLPDAKHVIIVSPFLNENGIQKINSQIDQLLSTNTNADAFMSLISRNLIFISNKNQTRDAVINYIAERLQKEGYAEAGIGEAAIKREKLASTAIHVVSTPHAPVKYVKRPAIAIYIDNKGILWQGKNIKVVFFLALNQEVKGNIEKIYEYFDDILENKHLINQIATSNSVEEVIELLKEGEK